MFTIVDVALEANTNSFALLRARIGAFAAIEDPKVKGTPSFVRLTQIKQLHFMSLQIFEDRHFDPLLIFENNFDGEEKTYWQELLQLIGEDLRAIFSCTKPAMEERWKSLFTEGSTLPLLPFIEAYAVSPSASHIGALGITRERVDRDRAVFEAIQTELGTGPQQPANLTPSALHRKMRDWALPRYGWLNGPETSNVPAARRSARWRAVQRILPALMAVVLAAISVVFVGRSPLFSSTVHWEVRGAIILVAVAVLLFAVMFWRTLRHVEETDMTQENPSLDPAQLAAFATQEDEIVQNHLASMVLVKPGAARSLAIRGSLGALKFLVPFIAADGYLGSMRTIHFAHWTLIGNSGRLMFLSNFDGSWQSYLDDFVDKAHGGLTLAWGNCVGFPRTKDLTREGATHGTQFKAWARQSQTQSLFWYSGYADLTVNQIWRNAAIVDGLRKPQLTEAQASIWCGLL
ncbi:MAG: hypothetical protein WB680_15890 [Candidatus Acidiferrales bacterium]